MENYEYLYQKYLYLEFDKIIGELYEDLKALLDELVHVWITAQNIELGAFHFPADFEVIGLLGRDKSVIFKEHITDAVIK